MSQPKDTQSSWLKHADFMLIDVVCLQVSFVLAYWLTVGIGNPYEQPAYFYQAVVLLTAQLLVILFLDPHHGVLRRGSLGEARAVVVSALWMLAISLVWLFIVHDTGIASRLQFGFTLLLWCLIAWIVRQAEKARVTRPGSAPLRSVALVTSSSLAPNAMRALAGGDKWRDFEVRLIVLLDGGNTVPGWDIEAIPWGEEALAALNHGWVDEVVILQPEEMLLPAKLMRALVEMGIDVSYTNEIMASGAWPMTGVGKVGEIRAVRGTVHCATPGQSAVKRLIDVVGGLVGCLVCVLLYPFVAFAVKSVEPGPAIFSQERVGRNGRTFMMYKFRSMYVNAEERKASLAAENKVASGMMFKIESDPRILPGVGPFIRRTSIDEFPQFLNVLKGEMSLVGTRPPTLDEWARYTPAHRARMAVKPGITGLWQVSGRSSITDFDEVVRLDREYIDTWSPYLDVKILLKTVGVVVRGTGAE